MRRTSLWSVVLLTVVACAERPTGPPDDLLSRSPALSSTHDAGPLASSQWQLTTRGLVRARSVSPIASARVYALLSIAQYAAVDAADDARSDGDKTELRRGAIAAASAKVLTYLFPLDATAVANQLAAEALAGTPDQAAAFARGRTAGEQMGNLIVARGRADGFAQASGAPLVWDPTTLRTGTGVWRMDADAVPQVPAGFQFPGMRPYFLNSNSQFRAPAPPDDFSRELNEVISLVQNRTADQAALAVALNQSAGTVTTAGVFADIAATFIAQHNMDDRAATHVYALLHTGIMDAVTACWDSKFEYLVMRPWQVAPLALPRPLLIIGRPNHPSYPSGHSCVSGAAATVLERFFPAQRTMLEQQVVDNGMSRIYAGIHYRMDVEAGQQLGRSVADWAVRYDQRNGLLAAVLPQYRGNDDR